MKMSKEKLGDVNNVLKRVEDFLGLTKDVYTESSLIENIKEICVARLCVSVGVECCYNYKSDFFEFYSEIFGQAICDILGLRLTIASDELRLIKYNHINLVEEVKKYILEKEMEEAVLDSFNLIDGFQFLIPHHKRFKERN